MEGNVFEKQPACDDIDQSFFLRFLNGDEDDHSKNTNNNDNNNNNVDNYNNNTYTLIFVYI